MLDQWVVVTMVDQLVRRVCTGKRQSLKASRLAFGSLMTKKWSTFADPGIIRINNDLMADVLRIYHENFTEINDRMFTMYCRFFNETCYAFLDRGKVVGYCIFFVRPVFSHSHIHKTATLYSFAVDSDHRGYGIGKRLLQKGIREMKLNSVSCISLYVARENLPAISLYKKMGFRILRELEDVCGPGLKCYEMDLELGNGLP